MRKTIITILFMFFAFSSRAQINDETELIFSMKWLIENPQIESKNIFKTKANDISAWKLNNTKNPKLHLQERVNFIMNLGVFKYANELTIIYDFGDFIEKFENDHYKEKLFEFYSIKGILKYYKNLIKLDKDSSSDYLDKLNLLTDEELTEKLGLEI